MIDRFERRPHSFHRHHVGSRRAGDHDNLDTEYTCGFDLRVGSRAAAILGNDGLDAVFPQKIKLAFEREGTAVEEIFDVGKGKRRIDRIDAAHQIKMLRSDLGMRGALAAGRQKDTPRCRAKRGDGRWNIRNDVPMIAWYWHPFGTDECDDGYAAAFGCGRGIGRNAFGERMGRINQQVVTSGHQEIGEALRTAEAADADGNRLFCRSLRAARQRQQDVEVFSRGKFGGKSARFARAAEDQNAGPVHV